MHRTRHHRGARAAFSLIELVVAVAIIGTVASIAGPRYGAALASYRADAAAQRIVADLGWAREMARSESRRVVVRFRRSEDRYYFENEIDPRTGLEYAVELLDPPLRAEVDTVDFDGREHFAFNCYGMLIRHDNGLLFDADGEIIVSSSGRTRRIVVNRTSGRAVLD